MGTFWPYVHHRLGGGRRAGIDLHVRDRGSRGTLVEREKADKRAGWETSPVVDHPVGPDDAGNAVMVGVGFVVSGWRWLVGKVTRTTRPR
jgi:hypothetical protein